VAAPDPAVASQEAESLIEFRLFGHRTSLVQGREATQQQHGSVLRTYPRAWSLLLAITALPDTKAVGNQNRRAPLAASRRRSRPPVHSHPVQPFQRTPGAPSIATRSSTDRRADGPPLPAAGLTAVEARRVVCTEGGL
jgi:hypothetical protein